MIISGNKFLIKLQCTLNILTRHSWLHPYKYSVTIFISALMLLKGCSVSTIDIPDVNKWKIPASLPKEKTISNTFSSDKSSIHSYVVNGKRYWVKPVAVGYKETGLASWYGRKFHGRLTANQEVYNMYKFTAAHKSLPLPSYIKVLNHNNNRSVTVRVNDRGPFVEGRIIDLSYAAAKQIGMEKAGIAPVTIEVINIPTQRRNNTVSIFNSNDSQLDSIALNVYRDIKHTFNPMLSFRHRSIPNLTQERSNIPKSKTIDRLFANEVLSDYRK